MDSAPDLGPLSALLALAAVLFIWIWNTREDRSVSRQEARDRAERLLWEFLSREEQLQMLHGGYLLVSSPGIPDREYRVPVGPGRVKVYDSGRLTMRLCLRLVDPLPEGDVVLMHKLLIQGDEREYLHVAQHLPLRPGSRRREGFAVLSLLETLDWAAMPGRRSEPRV